MNTDFKFNDSYLFMIRSILVSVKQRSLTVAQGVEEIRRLIDRRDDLVMETVRLATTELEREITWLKSGRD